MNIDKGLNRILVIISVIFSFCFLINYIVTTNYVRYYEDMFIPDLIFSIILGFVLYLFLRVIKSALKNIILWVYEGFIEKA